MLITLPNYMALVEKKNVHGWDRWEVLLMPDFAAGSKVVADLAFEPSEVMVRQMVSAWFKHSDAEHKRAMQARVEVNVRTKHTPFGSKCGPIAVR